jgi:hypothetical protein
VTHPPTRWDELEGKEQQGPKASALLSQAEAGDAQGTGATVSDAGSIEHAHRSIVFGASFLRIERGPLPTTQCAISLEEKVSSSQASYSRGTCPLRGTEE